MKRTFSRKTSTAIMCHDPSMTAWGWSIVTPKGKVLDHGCIKTESSANRLKIRKGDDRIRRLVEINKTLKMSIQKHEPVLHLCELPHGSQNASAAIMVGAVGGIISTIAYWTTTPIEYYSEGDAKKALSGNRILSKDDTVKLIGKKYKVGWHGVKYYDEAVADSLAIFEVAKQTSEVLKFLRK